MNPRPSSPRGRRPAARRVLIVAPPGTESVALPDGAEVLVVAPVLSATIEALTGAANHRRADAETTAQNLRRDARGMGRRLGADMHPRSRSRTRCASGADEVIVVGYGGTVDAIRARVAIPVSRA